MIAKKHITFPLVCLVLFSAAIGADNNPTITHEEHSAQTTQISTTTTESSNLTHINLKTPNMIAARAALETAGGVALCLMPQAAILRLTGLALTCFGVDTIYHSKETQDILCNAANKAVDEGTIVAYKIHEKAKEIKNKVEQRIGNVIKEQKAKDAVTAKEAMAKKQEK
jgi:hypothetical protein